MPYQTWIADRIKNEVQRSGVPVTVREVSGWRTRGSSVFAPRAVITHHDASSLASGNNGALNICIHGRAGLPGPLCQVFIRRNGDIDIVAAGRANHAGSGGWRGLSGNTSVFGIEAANNGVGEPWSPVMLDAYRAVTRALLAGISRDFSWCGSHKEWTTRKIDPRGGPNDFTTARHIDPFRRTLGQTVTTLSLGDRVLERGMEGRDVRQWQEMLVAWRRLRPDERYDPIGVDGVFGPQTAWESTRALHDAGLRPSDPARPRIGPVSIEAVKKRVQELGGTPNPEDRSWFEMATESDLRRVIREETKNLPEESAKATWRMMIRGWFGELRASTLLSRLQGGGIDDVRDEIAEVRKGQIALKERLESLEKHLGCCK